MGLSVEDIIESKKDRITLDSELVIEMIKTINFYAKKQHITNRIDNPQAFELPQYDGYDEEILIEDGTKAAEVMEKILSIVKH